MTPDDRARRTGWAASLGCLAALVLLDVALDDSLVVLTGLFSLAPLIACAVLPTRSTALVAALAVVAALTSSGWNDAADTSQHYVRVLGVTLIGSTAVVIAAVRVGRERRIQELVQIAEVAQRAILPVLPPAAGGMAISSRYASAVEGTLVGGDLYDCYHDGEVTRLLIGDVRGKGMEGVEQAARVIRAFRQAAARRTTLLEVVEDMDAYLTPFFDDEEFVTALVIEALDPGHLLLVSAGHPPALLSRVGQPPDTVEVPQGLPLGTGLPASYKQVELAWGPGDRLLLYTDGLSEARDERGEFLELTRLQTALGAPDALDAVLDTVHRHVRGGRLSDDLALVLLERAD